MIPYGKQEITEADKKAVMEVLGSDFITQGQMVPEFEHSIANYCGVSHAVAVSSATSALHVACLALGLGPGDWLWTSPVTFVASANCGVYCGANIDFVDIDSRTYNISVDKLEQKLKAAAKQNRLPKVLIPVHLCGQSCEMEPIHALAQRYGFYIVEDASHAIGGRYKGLPVGSCEWSNITVFSFHPVKIITTAEGGIATTNDVELYTRMQELRNHGITRDESRMTHAAEGPWYYQQIDLGYNYRMTDIQAALGCSQLNRLDYYVNTRNRLAEHYDEALKSLPIRIPYQHPDSLSARHLYVIQLQLSEIEKTHREVFEELRKKGIGVNLHYIPVHLQPYYLDMGFSAGDFPEAEAYYATSISIPLFPTMSNKQQQTVIGAIESVILQ